MQTFIYIPTPVNCGPYLHSPCFVFQVLFSMSCLLTSLLNTATLLLNMVPLPLNIAPLLIYLLPWTLVPQTRTLLPPPPPKDNPSPSLCSFSSWSTQTHLKDTIFPTWSQPLPTFCPSTETFLPTPLFLQYILTLIHCSFHRLPLRKSPGPEGPNAQPCPPFPCQSLSERKVSGLPCLWF